MNYWVMFFIYWAVTGIGLVIYLAKKESKYDVFIELAPYALLLGGLVTPIIIAFFLPSKLIWDAFNQPGGEK